jgi:putative spermidine/putrescine transport system permease protein
MRSFSIAFFLTFGVLPLAAGLVYALLYSVGMVGALATGFDLTGWQKALGDRSLWSALALSASVAVAVVGLSTGLALAVLRYFGAALDRPRVRFLLHFPLAVPPLVAAFVSFQWLGSAGMLARWAGVARPEDFPPLINDPLYVGVLLTLTLTTFPFLLLIFLHQYRAAQLLAMTELATTLGADAAQIQRRVVVPVLLRRAQPTLVLYGIFLFGAYEVPLLLGRQNPSMVSMFINQKFRRFDLADLPVAYVATVLYAVVVLLAVLFFLKKNTQHPDQMSADQQLS